MHHKLPHYKCAANLLKLAKETGANIKHILYNEKKYRHMNIKSLFALVSEALKHWNTIELLINDSNILNNEPGFNIWHVRIMITELIFGKKEIDGENTFGYKILQYESKFKELLARQDVKELVPCKKNLGVKVRYIKVNPIKETVDSAIGIFTDEGWRLLPTASSYQEYLDQLRSLEPHSESFVQDFHIPEVLVFPPGTELHSHHLYKNGSFFFMDKSSCLAPYLLRPGHDSCVLDMCAAPGLKAIQLAGLVQSGKVYAVERNSVRYQSLRDMVVLSGADNVVPIHKDSTELQLDKYADVNYILLDPSCTGSGMQERQPLVTDHADSDDKQRLYKLAGFQLTLLRFALTRFPSVKRVVYSTCSLNVEENEEVVEAALNSKYHNFKISSISKRLPGWINFGSQKFSFGSKCIYSKPEVDLTNGFFVAVFKRRKHQITKHLSEFVSNSNDELSYSVSTSNEHSNIVFDEIRNDNKCIRSSNVSRKGSVKIDSNYSKYNTLSNTINVSDEGILLKTNEAKKRVSKTAPDVENNVASFNKFQGKHDGNISYDQKIGISGLPKSLEGVKKTTDEKIKSNKLISKSKKKRLRQLRRKSELLQTSNKIKRQKKKDIKGSLIKNSNCSELNVKKCEKVKTDSQFNGESNSNGAVLKSKAQLRYLRAKKFKVKTNIKNGSKLGTRNSTSLPYESKDIKNKTSDQVKKKVSFPSVLKDSSSHIECTAIDSSTKSKSKEEKHKKSKEGGESDFSIKRKKKRLSEDDCSAELISSSNSECSKNKKHKKKMCKYDLDCQTVNETN